MARIAVFDSGLGSLGVVRAIRRASACDIIYYADTASHPYGAKTIRELCNIVHHTIHGLQERFAPDMVVVGSNTPTLLLDNMESPNVMGVWPPIHEAVRLGDSVTALATRSVAESGAVGRYAHSLGISIHVQEVNASALVNMAETGRFLDAPQECRGIIHDILYGISGTCILASTHLLFLLDLLESVRPDITFLDPALITARRVVRATGHDGNSTLQVYSSGGHDIAPLLYRLGVSEPVQRLGINTK